MDIQFAQQFGYKIKLLAIGKEVAGEIEARVHPTMIPQNAPLADVDGVFNAVRLVGDFVGPVMLYGQGAGMDATASAVMGDAMAIARNLLHGAVGRTPAMGYCASTIGHLPIRAMSDIVSRYYLRFTTIDQPGVVARIASILGNYKIGISSMIQPEEYDVDMVPIVIMTHDAKEAEIRSALAEIDELDVVLKPSHFIRIENSIE